MQQRGENVSMMQVSFCGKTIQQFRQANEMQHHDRSHQKHCSVSNESNVVAFLLLGSILWNQCATCLAKMLPRVYQNCPFHLKLTLAKRVVFQILLHRMQMCKHVVTGLKSTNNWNVFKGKQKQQTIQFPHMKIFTTAKKMYADDKQKNGTTSNTLVHRNIWL